MDTSKEYIQMCETAIEIQALAEKYNQIDSCVPNLYAKYKEEKKSETIIPPEGQNKDYLIDIWLPRQDQLQDLWNQREDAQKHSMNKHPIIFLNNLKMHMEEIIGKVIATESMGEMSNTPRRSMEQWTLSLVMKHLYKKSWSVNSKEWVSEEISEEAKRRAAHTMKLK